ncbi:nitrilase-related carbon-nitrogen hydrolase [Sodalis glossinidius]|uniref:nitrilase-related carbon-nitrogen hydrolase n=1 Tax=Sodalis glossinidius TaxID=63612 RepID=UPI001F5B3BF6|nr:nitrilase-related carbon-nitrogen hydrolase [Sodalis glossinidius]
MINVALAQIDTVLGNKGKNLDHIKSFFHRAADNKANIICFPELATTGYTPDLLGTSLWNLSESRGGETDLLCKQTG